MLKVLHDDEISGALPKSLKVYQWFQETKGRGQIKGISRQDSDSEEASGE